MTTKAKGRNKSVPPSPRSLLYGFPLLRVSSSTAPSIPASPRLLDSVIMDSKSDWETMRYADQTLTDFGVAHDCKVMSAHRTPHLAADFASSAESRGVEIIIAAGGGAAHLAGVLAAHTVLLLHGVPM